MNKAQKLEAILVIVLGLSILSIVFDGKVLFYVAIAIGVGSLIIPQLRDAILYLWFKIAQILGWINTRILLAIVFFLFLFPLGLVYRFFSKDPLKLKNNRDSLFTTKNHQYQKKEMENIW